MTAVKGARGFAIQFNRDGVAQLLLSSCRAEQADVETDLESLRSCDWCKNATDVRIVPVLILIDDPPIVALNKAIST